MTRPLVGSGIAWAVKPVRKLGPTKVSDTEYEMAWTREAESPVDATRPSSFNMIARVAKGRGARREIESK